MIRYNSDKEISKKLSEILTEYHSIRHKFENRQSLDEGTHGRVMDLFKKYLLVGGLPDAVVTYTETKNIVQVRAIQNEIHEYYAMDAGKYDKENRLKINRIYGMIPPTVTLCSTMIIALRAKWIF